MLSLDLCLGPKTELFGNVFWCRVLAAVGLMLILEFLLLVLHMLVLIMVLTTLVFDNITACFKIIK